MAFPLGRLFLATILVSILAPFFKTVNADSLVLNAKPGKKTFDFIIVGGGTAGGVLGERLSVNFSVLVLESGGVPPEVIYTPRMATEISDRPVINYRYRSTRQRKAALQVDGIVSVTAGRMLGGGSSHNSLIWTRGSAASYDEWAELTGDDSWKYKNMLEYFKKIENYHGSYPNNGQHGQNGPVDINEDSYTLGAELWQKGGIELGYQINDTNGPQTVGFGPTAFTKNKGRRVNTYKAYIEPALQRPGSKLTVSLQSTVSRILFNKKTAIGVEYIQNGSQISAYASKEVVISAGVFVSPVILIKSGIGPKDQVKGAKVNQIAELPVGRNLIDHPKMELPFYLNDSKLSWHMSRNLTAQDSAVYKYNGTGPLSASDQQEEAHILSTRQQDPLDPVTRKSAVDQSLWPDLLIAYTPFGSEPNSVYCTLGNYRPRSRGVLTVNFTATDEEYWPIIDFNFYADETDLDVMVDGVNFCLKLMETTTGFSKVGAKISSEPYRPCKAFKLRSQEYWKCYIKYRTRTGYHSVGTCKMGSGKNDPTAVVDSKLRVIGVQNLRVVDASIMPTISNANTAAPTYAIAEKAASDILRDYSRKTFF